MELSNSFFAFMAQIKRLLLHTSFLTIVVVVVFGFTLTALCTYAAKISFDAFSVVLLKSF